MAVSKTEGKQQVSPTHCCLSTKKEGFTPYSTFTDPEPPNLKSKYVYLSAGTNVALRKPANQSTTVRGGAAANGNDGESTTVHDGKRCTETMKEASPWWMVDLLKPYPIGVVRVTTRGCCGKQIPLTCDSVVSPYVDRI